MTMEFTYHIDGRDLTVTIEKVHDQTIVRSGDETFTFDHVVVTDRWITVTQDGCTTRVPYARSSTHVLIGLGGRAYELAPADNAADDADCAGGFVAEISSPMPGRVLDVLVAAGDEVSADTPLVLLEAMKMEQTVRTRTDAKVIEVRVEAGEMVGPGQILVILKALDDTAITGTAESREPGKSNESNESD
jgi:biotin carboxyl carrier protein